MNEKEIRFIDLFGGIGGFRLGLQKTSERYQCVYYCEIDKYAVQTYNKNFKEQHHPQDITELNPADLPDFDLICGGFPCQSFSIAGKRQGFKDTRGTLFYEICRIASEKRPRMLFLENVKGLLSHDKGNTFRVILESLDELGYDAEWQVLNSKNFGVPQNRERIFIIGHLRNRCGQAVFPIRYNDRSYETISKKSKEKKLWVHDLCISQTIQTDGFGATIINEGERMMVADFRNDEGLRIRKDMIAPTLAQRKHSESDVSTMPPIIMNAGAVRSGGRGSIDRHQWDIVNQGNHIRRLTPVECERLQGFPDNWTDGVSDTQRYKQLGNAVTVNVIQAIGKKILEVW